MMEIIVFVILLAGWFILLAPDGKKLELETFGVFIAGYMAGCSLFLMYCTAMFGANWKINASQYEMMLVFVPIVFVEMAIRHRNKVLF